MNDCELCSDLIYQQSSQSLKSALDAVNFINSLNVYQHVTTVNLKKVKAAVINIARRSFTI